MGEAAPRGRGPGAVRGTSALVRPYFRLWSRVYDSPVFQDVYFHRVHRRLLAATRGLSPGAILDVGCGTGELLGALGRRWPEARLAGVDLSPEMLAVARAKHDGGDVELVEGNVGALPWGDQAFDLITSSISSHYYLDLPLALAEIHRVARPGATVAMASLGNGPLRFVPGPLGREVRAMQSVYRSPGRQREQLREAGLPVERVERLPGMGWLYLTRRA